MVKANQWLKHLELKSSAPKEKRIYLMKWNAELSWTPYCSIEILQFFWARSIYRFNCVYATTAIESFLSLKHQYLIEFHWCRLQTFTKSKSRQGVNEKTSMNYLQASLLNFFFSIPYSVSKMAGSTRQK